MDRNMGITTTIQSFRGRVGELLGCKRLLALFAGVLVLATGTAIAQDSRGVIRGQVVDPQGAIIPQATVLLTNIQTEKQTKLSTNQAGEYSAPLLPIGMYRLEAEAPGFKRYVRGSLELHVDDSLQVDIRLEVGAASESVTVSAEAPMLGTVDSSAGRVVDSKAIDHLPIAYGNEFLLIGTATGTTFEGNPKMNRPFEPSHIVAYAMNGTRANKNDVTMDGIPNSAFGGNGTVTAAYVPPSDAVAEFKVQTSGFDAKVGESLGGTVNLSLKSGGNAPHGTAYYSNMAKELSANDFFANRTGQPRGNVGFNRWGTSLTGPVYIPKIYDGHNKTFFMFAYEGMVDNRPRGATMTVPTAAQRTGDLSQLLSLGSNYQIYNPFTRRPTTNGRYQEDPFPGNIIPSNLISPVATNVLKYISLPNTSGSAASLNNLTLPNALEHTRYYTETERVDHMIGDKDRLFITAASSHRQSQFGDWFQTAASGQSQDFLARRAAFDNVYTASPTFIVDVRYGYTRYLRQTLPMSGVGFDLTKLGFPASFNNSIPSAARQFPYFSVGNNFSTQNLGENKAMDTHSFAVAFTKTHGSHFIEFGAEPRIYRYNQYVLTTTQSGAFGFNANYANGPIDNSAWAPAGQDLTMFMLGLPSSTSYIMRNADYAEQSTVWGFYLMDTWRVSSRLNITIGARYEVEGPLTERYNRSVRDFNYSAVLPQSQAAEAAYAANYAANPTLEVTPSQFKVLGGLRFAGVNGQPRDLWNRDSKNVMPRVGIAYSLNSKTVLRTGYGIYRDLLGVRRTDVNQLGFSRQTMLVPTMDNGLTFTSTLSNPYPSGILEPLGVAGGTQTGLGTAVSFFNPNPVPAYMQRWQFSIQRQISSSILLDVAYVGNHGAKIETTRDLNQLGNQYLSTMPVRDQQRIDYLTAVVPNPFYGLPNVTGTLGLSKGVGRATLLAPYPQFSSVTTTFNNGASWYHSLQANFQKHFSHGLTTSVGYTWSKFMEALDYLNSGDASPIRSISPQDHTHRLTATWIYALPFGRGAALLSGARGFENALVGGWQVSGFYTLQSGDPLTWGSDTLYTPNGQPIALGGRNVDQWFNVNAGFVTNSSKLPLYHYRTWPLRFSNIRGDFMNNLDLSVMKDWRVTEHVKLQYRADFLNAMNHQKFVDPSTYAYNSTFGKVTDTATYPRQIQMSFKVLF